VSLANRANNYAFIDSQNLNLAIRDQAWILDYKRFRKYLEQKYNVSRAFLFIGYIPSNENLYNILQGYGYLLIFKPTLDLQSGGTKGNVDAELVLHSVIEMQNYDRAIIVSGDGDYHCLIEYLIKQDKLLYLIIPNRYKYSSLLKKFVNKIVFMNTLKEKLEYKKR
jgi:uncharacterized LabA/DUF88 family protein